MLPFSLLPLFADVTMSEGQLTALVAVVTALFAGVVQLVNSRHKNRLEANAAAIAALNGVIDRMKNQVDTQQVMLLHIQSGHQDCQKKSARQETQIALWTAWAQRVSLVMQRAGIECEPPPSMPTYPGDDDREDDEFRERRAAHNAQTVEAIRKSFEARTTPPPGGAA